MSPLTKYVLRNLGTRPLATSFALLSMVLVGFTISSLSAIGLGLLGVFETHEPDTIVLVQTKNAEADVFSRLPIDIVGRLTARSKVVRSSVESMLFASLPPSESGKLDYVSIRGLDPAGFELHRAKIVEGHMPDPNGEEILVGASLYRHYPWLKIGRSYEVHRTYHFTIVGVFQTGTVLDDEMWTMRATMMRRQKDEARTSFAVAYLEAANAADAHALVDEINGERGLRAEAVIPGEWRRKRAMEGFGPFYRWLSILIVLVASGALLAAGSEIVVLFLRRLGDMAVLRTFGFGAATITRLLLFEIGILVLGGGALGLALALLLVRGASLQVAGSGMGVNFVPVLSPGVLAGTLGVMAFVGLLASVWPIVKVMRSEIRDQLH